MLCRASEEVREKKRFGPRRKGGKRRFLRETASIATHGKGRRPLTREGLARSYKNKDSSYGYRESQLALISSRVGAVEKKGGGVSQEHKTSLSEDASSPKKGKTHLCVWRRGVDRRWPGKKPGSILGCLHSSAGRGGLVRGEKQQQRRRKEDKKGKKKGPGEKWGKASPFFLLKICHLNSTSASNAMCGDGSRLRWGEAEERGLCWRKKEEF